MSNNALTPIPLTPAPIGFGPGGPLPVPSPWTIYGSYISWSGGVVVGSPIGGNEGPGTINTSNLYINGVSVIPSNFLQLSGGTVTGPLTVNTGPATINSQFNINVGPVAISCSTNISNALTIGGPFNVTSGPFTIGSGIAVTFGAGCTFDGLIIDGGTF